MYERRGNGSTAAAVPRCAQACIGVAVTTYFVSRRNVTRPGGNGRAETTEAHFQWPQKQDSVRDGMMIAPIIL